jgi:hypothetical protein
MTSHNREAAKSAKQDAKRNTGSSSSRLASRSSRLRGYAYPLNLMPIFVFGKIGNYCHSGLAIGLRNVNLVKNSVPLWMTVATRR